MAFIHFNIAAGSTKSKYYCKIDGFDIISFKDGDYTEIANGHHVISFDSSITRWNIQETLSENDCIEVTMILSIDEGIVGEPQYEIVTLSSEEAMKIHNDIKAANERNEAKSDKFRKMSGIVTGVVIGLPGVVACIIGLILGVTGAFEAGVACAIGGAVCALIGVAILKAGLKKK